MRSVFFIMVLSFLLGGCFSNDKSDRTIIEINKYKMSKSDFKHELKDLNIQDKQSLKSQDALNDYVERVIEREILLQEAQKLGLDRNKEFMRTIERYWEQALLKLLIQQKSREISRLIHVYDNEIEKYYNEMETSQSLNEVRKEIESIIRHKKEELAFNNWIEGLKKSSHIKINNKLIKEILKGERP